MQYKLTEINLAHTSFRKRMSNMMYKVTVLDGSEIFLDVIKGLMDEMLMNEMIHEINDI